MSTLDRPVPFPGSRDQALANYHTHFWVRVDDEIRCADCDCRPSGTYAKYPCCTDVPREQVEI